MDVNTRRSDAPTASIDRLSISVDRLDDPAALRAAVEHALVRALGGKAGAGIERAERRSIAARVASEVASRIGHEPTRRSAGAKR